jgi:hypothetical protein
VTRAFCRSCSQHGADNDQQTSSSLSSSAAHAGGSGSGGWHGPKGGALRMEQPSQHVLQRTSIVMTNEYIEARFTVSLPARV